MAVDAELLKTVFFAGDPHGDFSGLNHAALSHRPRAMFMLGDFELEASLDDMVHEAAAVTDLWWIYGNHDVTREHYYDYLFGSGLAHRCLSGGVVTIDNLRVAGLGGHFLGRIWHPLRDEGRPRYRTREKYLATVPMHERWNGGLPRKARAAIFPEDVEALWHQRADVLITHEAPSCHPHGFRIIDDLAEAMGATLIVHGHHHVTYGVTYHERPLTALGVGLGAVTDGRGRVIVEGGFDPEAGVELAAEYRQLRDRPSGELWIPESPERSAGKTP